LYSEEFSLVVVAVRRTTVNLRTAGLMAKRLNQRPSDYNAGIIYRELQKHLSCLSCSGMLYSQLLFVTLEKLGYGSGDLTGRKLTRASEGEVLCGYRAVVSRQQVLVVGTACLSEWSACCVSQGQRRCVRQ
jgi:hypothetical protein